MSRIALGSVIFAAAVAAHAQGVPVPTPAPPPAAPAAAVPGATAAPAAAVPGATATPPKGAVAAAARADAINNQGMAAEGDRAAIERQLIRAEVLLDRRHFSPGVIDGRAGDNLRLALKAFQAAEGLPVNGKLDQTTWDKLVAGDTAPVIRGYTITVKDAAGPFAAPVTPGDYVQMSKRPNMTWTTVVEDLAERAHMDELLLTSLNPDVDFDVVGTELLVADTARSALPAVATIRVDKASDTLTAIDAAGKVVATYPATVGSSERPAPSGTLAVRTVAPAPSYTFDPSRLTFKAKGGGNRKLTIQPGPNNPVGSTWIDLTKDTYGIHGAPDPRLVGKVSSHGCVRLTNWDVRELAAAVKPGTKVIFTGSAPG